MNREHTEGPETGEREQLQPCPFCGGRIYRDTSGRTSWKICTACGSIGKAFINHRDQEAREAWIKWTQSENSPVY